MADSHPDLSQILPQQQMPDLGPVSTPTPNLAGSPGSPQYAAAQNKPPTPQPILAQLIAGLIHPQMRASAPGQEARPVSRLDTFESFLGNFVNALGQGLSAAHGPGAFGKGVGAAVTAPYQQAVGQFQLGQEAQANQAGIQEKQAQTGLYQKQAQLAGTMVTLPNGMTVPAKVAEQYLKGSGAAQINSQGHIQLEQWKYLVQQGQISKVMDGRDDKGNLVKIGYNKEGKPIATMQGALPSASYLPKDSSSVEYKTDADGNIIALPKNTERGVQIPGGAPPSGFPRAAGVRGGPRVVAQGKVPPMVFGSTSDGRQIAGTPSEVRAAGVVNQSPLPASEVAKVNIARQLVGNGGLFDLVNKDLQAFKPNELNGLSNRWQEFMTGTFGSDDRYVALRTHLNGLLGTALMQAHVGARGGEQLMEHFQDLANAGKMTYSNMKAAVDAERQYVQEKAMMPTKQNKGGGAVNLLVGKYGG